MFDSGVFTWKFISISFFILTSSTRSPVLTHNSGKFSKRRQTTWRNSGDIFMKLYILLVQKSNSYHIWRYFHTLSLFHSWKFSTAYLKINCAFADRLFIYPPWNFWRLSKDTRNKLFNVIISPSVETFNSWSKDFFHSYVFETVLYHDKDIFYSMNLEFYFSKN